MENILLSLSKEELKSLKIVELHKGTTLFLEGDECKNVGIVKSGELIIKSFLKSGKEITYNVIEPGSMFGNNLIFSSTPKYRGDVVAEKDSEIYLLSKETLLGLLSKNQKFLLAYLNYQSDFSKSLNLQIKLLSLDSAEDRFEYYLTFNKNIIRYKSISELARRLFLSRETLSRLISQMSKNKVIHIKDKTITLMVDKQN